LAATRRLFLQRAAFSIIAANFPLLASAQELFGSPAKGFDPESLALFDDVSAQTFEPWIGSRFRVSLNGQTRGSLVLLSVNEIGTEPQEDPDDANVILKMTPVSRFSNQSAITSFSLNFRGSGAALSQDTYMLAHDWLGNFPLFLVPSGLSGANATYTAVFSLLPRTGSTQLQRVAPQIEVR